MTHDQLIDKVIQAGYSEAVIQEMPVPAIGPDKQPTTRKELWLIAEPYTLLDSDKKDFALVQVLHDAGIPFAEITTYCRSIIARGIKLELQKAGTSEIGKSA